MAEIATMAHSGAPMRPGKNAGFAVFFVGYGLLVTILLITVSSGLLACFSGVMNDVLEALKEQEFVQVIFPLALCFTWIGAMYIVGRLFISKFSTLGKGRRLQASYIMGGVGMAAWGYLALAEISVLLHAIHTLTDCVALLVPLGSIANIVGQLQEINILKAKEAAQMPLNATPQIST